MSQWNVCGAWAWCVTLLTAELTLGTTFIHPLAPPILTITPVRVQFRLWQDTCMYCHLMLLSSPLPTISVYSCVDGVDHFLLVYLFYYAVKHVITYSALSQSCDQPSPTVRFLFPGEESQDVSDGAIAICKPLLVLCAAINSWD